MAFACLREHVTVMASNGVSVDGYYDYAYPRAGRSPSKLASSRFKPENYVSKTELHAPKKTVNRFSICCREPWPGSDRYTTLQKRQELVGITKASSCAHQKKTSPNKSIGLGNVA